MNIPDKRPSKRFSIIGCNITRANMKSAINYVKDNITNKIGGYVCFTNVHASVMGRQNLDYRSALNNSYMTLPDGKPLYWYAHIKGLGDVGHVPGPDFLPSLIKETHQTGLKHYFFGSTQQVLDALTENLRNRYPAITIVGSYSPPFRDLSKEESDEIINNINNVTPDIIWIGLGAPKQERWMEENWQKLKPALLMGVGAAFDFHAGTIKRAPNICTRLGVEWLYRLLQEPRRLFGRYLITNSLFLWFLIVDSLKQRII